MVVILFALDKVIRLAFVFQRVEFLGVGCGSKRFVFGCLGKLAFQDENHTILVRCIGRNAIDFGRDIDFGVVT